jgi:hypothetical protein
MEIQEIIKDCFENLYFNKFENLEKMDRFLYTYDDPNWTTRILITWIDL